VDERLVRELARILDRPLETRLTQALLFRAKLVAFTREEKQRILAALEREPAFTELASLRDLLLADEHWHQRRPLLLDEEA
jgi:hypothetical protein